MLEALSARRHDDRGFTLIELMVVVLIIGILISVGLPTFLGARSRAQDRAAQAQLRTGMAAAKTYYTDSNSYSGLTTTNIKLIEQSIDWQSAATTTGPVNLLLTGTTTVTLTTLSGSGQWFCLKDVSGDSTPSNNGIFYGRGGTEAAARTACTATTTGGWTPTA